MTPDAIYQRRQTLGLTQVQLAAQLGVDPSTVSRWECGSRPMPRVAERLLATLKAPKKETASRPELHLPLNEPNQPLPVPSNSFPVVAPVDILPPVQSPPQKRMTLVEELRSGGYEVIDRRPAGRLWVVGGEELREFLKAVDRERGSFFRQAFTPAVAIRGRMGWWTNYQG
ncbi:MAG: helix-turn-helix protein [candidate division NC10 bacterium]|nr:helix-turn-helix protein [candidate division NC10 bacterium]